MKTELTNFAAAATAASLQSCPTLCNPIDGSPPGFPIPGILQARILFASELDIHYVVKSEIKDDF